MRSGSSERGSETSESRKVPGLTEAQVKAIGRWGAAVPRIAGIFIYGSRAKDTFNVTSDVDIALQLTEDPEDGALGLFIFRKDAWRWQLEKLDLGFAIDLQLMMADDVVVTPAVRDHGIEIYRVPRATT